MSNKITLKFGAYLGGAGVFLQIVQYLLDMHVTPHWFFSVLNYAVIISCIVWAINLHKQSREKLSLTQALKIGVGVAVAGGFIIGVYNIVFMKFIEPGFIDQIMAEKQKIFISEGYNEEQMSKLIEMAKKMSTPGITLAVSMISMAFLGFIISIIAGFILKRKK